MIDRNVVYIACDREAPSSAQTVDEAKHVLAQVYAPEHCWREMLFKQPSPYEAAKAAHNALLFSDWRSKAGIK